MKKQDIYYEKERMMYIIAIIKGDSSEASLHMGRMQGYIDAMCNMSVDFVKICYMHDRLISAIDFAYRMKRLAKKNFSN